jgi:hypothetical protein
MKKIVSLLMLAMLVLPVMAFPDNIENNPDVCKMYMDSGSSMSIVYVWHNPDTDLWEAKLGYGAYNGPSMLPITFASDVMGTIDIDLMDMSAVTR